MRAPATSMTSKTSSLKALLLRAWRERWNDLQWSIHIKTILPRGVSGDVYNLADCILQQALVGRGPNQLVISYLMHSLSSQLVSYAAVLQSISKYDGFHKSHCVVTLLEFLETIESGITCRGKPEEGLLAASVLSIVQWLLTCLIYAIKNPLTIKEHPEILDLPVKILNNMVSNDFTVAMLYLAKHEARETYQEVVKKVQEIEVILPKSTVQPAKSVSETLTKICKLDMESFPNQNETTEPLTFLLQPLLAVEVLLNPSTETSTFVNQLLMVQRLKNYCNTRLYSEIMRACLTSLNDVLGTNKESQWGAFMFLKVPHILKQLHLTKNEGIGDKMEFSQEVVDSFDYLLQYTPLLDVMDAKCSCSCIECLLNELQKVNLVTEAQVKAIVAKREATTQAVQKLDLAATAAGLNAQGQNASIPKVIIRAEPTLARILKTLDADYLKIQEALLSVLGQVLTGKSFELILAVATVEGKLRSFVSKLIKFNECSKQVGGEVGKAAVTRAMLFDTSFLMLCSIVHTYGSQVVLSEGRGDSFFERWVRDSMVERGRPKSPDAALVGIDPAKVDALLAQFNGPDGADFKTGQAKWQEICLHIPATIKEVLLAWEHGAIQATDVKRILDAMRSRMCCLPVCAAAWLCSYMQILHQDALLKPMNMVQQFLTPPTASGITSPASVGAAGTEEPTGAVAGAVVPAGAQDNFKERAGLMHVIVRKMQYDVRPPCRTKGGAMSHCVISSEPISEQLAAAWTEIQARGWVTIDATHLLERLLNTGGAQWFVDTIVRELMRLRYREELDRAVDLAFAVFHLDIEQCTLALLGHTLPYYLNDKLASEELVEPQSSALARLSAYGAYGALEAQRGSAAAAAGRKRGRSIDDGADLGTPAKLMRLAHGLAESADTPLFPSSPSPTDGPAAPVLRVREPLEGALARLYSALAVIAGRDGEVSQQTHFICRLVQCLLRCGMDDTRRLIVQGLPTTLVPSLLRSLPELFSTGLLLRLYDLETISGRRTTSRDLCLLRNLELKQCDVSKSQVLFTV